MSRAGLLAAALILSWSTAYPARAAQALEVVSSSGAASDDVVDDPRLGRYTTQDNKAFILDRTRDKARLKFDGSREILLLDMVPGPQGVIYFKDEFDRTILRLTPFGGATVYDEEGNEGDAYGRTDKAAPLELKPKTAGDVKRRIREVKESLNGNFDLKVAFDFEPGLDDVREQTGSADVLMAARADEGLAEIALSSEGARAAKSAPNPEVDRAGTTALADTVEVTNMALKRLARDDLAREVMAETIHRVVFRVANAKAVGLEGETLTVSYVPDLGLEGRPSSAAIERYLLENL